jgi:hypothetical protein
MKKVIIGIHGLGNKPSKHLLEKWWEDAMLEGLKKQNHNVLLPKFELIYWADILYDKPLDLLKKDPESPHYLDEPYVKSTSNFIVEDNTLRRKVIGLISEQLNKIFLNEDKTLNFQFVSDFILKNFFIDLEKYYSGKYHNVEDYTFNIKDLIRNRISEVLQKYQGYDIIVIAHSMGSIVAFDVLSFLMPNTKVNTFVTIGSPLGLPVVVSKIASENLLGKNSENCMVSPPGVTAHWFNLADILDKVALNYQLNDDFSANKHGVVPVDFLVVNDYLIGENKNPHKSFGYLRTPEMSQILYNFITEREKNLFRKFIEKLGKLSTTLRFKADH